jgi:hypothetical protein
MDTSPHTSTQAPATTDNSLAALSLAVKRLAIAIAVAVVHRRGPAQLAGGEDRLLAQLGLTRSDLCCALGAPSWQDPSALLRIRIAELRAERHRFIRDASPHMNACPSERRAPVILPASQRGRRIRFRRATIRRRHGIAGTQPTAGDPQGKSHLVLVESAEVGAFESLLADMCAQSDRQLLQHLSDCLDVQLSRTARSATDYLK